MSTKKREGCCLRRLNTVLTKIQPGGRRKIFRRETCTVRWAESKIGMKVFSFFLFFNFKPTTRSQVLLLHWPKSQHTLNPSVLSSARSKHTICFCFIQIIFTTCVLETVQPQPCSRRLSVIPPGCWRGTGWSLGPFLTVMEEPLKGPAWDRKPHSAMRRGV